MTKKMKKYILVMSALLLAPISLLAGSSGGTLITPWELTRPAANNWMLAQLYVTNITTEPVTIKLSLITSIDSSGNAVYYTDGDNSPTTGTINAYGNFLSYTETTSGATVSLQIPALETVKIVVTPPATISPTEYFMFGKLEWTGPSNAPVALIGRLHIQHVDSGSNIAAVPLNQGNPF